MSDIRQRRRRSRRNIKRIRQRNRRVLLSVVLLCFIVWAGFVNVSKQKKEQEAEQAYAEQQEKKAREAKEVKAGKEEKDEPVLAAESEKNKWYLKLVNAKNPMIQTDVPEVETETLDSEGYQVDARIMKDLEAMFEAARADGRSPMICSAFRAWDTQVSLYQNKIGRVMNEEGLNEEDAAIKAATVVAKPGTSEHQIGLALDIVLPSIQIWTKVKWKQRIRSGSWKTVGNTALFSVIRWIKVTLQVLFLNPGITAM